MKLTTKGRYGVRALICLVLSESEDPIAIKTIAAREDISPEFLEQIFYLLKKKGLIASVRGPGGGFLLNKKPEEITLMDIFDAVGESIAPAPCVDGSPDSKGCTRVDACLVTETWKNFHLLMKNFLSRITLRDILARKKTANAKPVKVPVV